MRTHVFAFPTSRDGTDWWIYGNTAKEQWAGMETEAYLEDLEWIVGAIDDILSDEFNEALADLQDSLGVDGGYASVYFSGKEDWWLHTHLYSRMRFLRTYIKHERAIDE